MGDFGISEGAVVKLCWLTRLGLLDIWLSVAQHAQHRLMGPKACG